MCSPSALQIACITPPNTPFVAFSTFRAFWLQSIPLLLITAFVAVLGFIQYGQYASLSFGVIDEATYSEVRQWLALAVGILGLLATILVAFANNTNYASQRDMHATAERTLSKVCQSVKFPERDDGTRLAEHLNTQKAILLAVASASTDVPPKILQVFKELGHIMDAKPFTFRAIQYERCYYLLWRMYAKRSCGKCNLWPLAIPEMTISSNKLGQAIEDEYAKFSAGMEEAIKRKDSSATAKTRNSSRSVSRGRSYARQAQVTAAREISTSTTSTSTTAEL